MLWRRDDFFQMPVQSGLTLELILNSGDYLSQLLSLRDNCACTLRGFLVRHVLIIMQCSLKRLENIHVLTREPVSSADENIGTAYLVPLESILPQRQILDLLGDFILLFPFGGRNFDVLFHVLVEIYVLWVPKRLSR
jgi:hypothetical protein